MILAASDVSGQASAKVRRVVDAVDEHQRTTLAGNTHPLARPEFAVSGAPSNLPMERMLLLLKRGDEQDAALEEFMRQQLDRSSPNYHHWLTPGQFGRQFGPSEDDVQVVTSWLDSHGFQVARVSKGRTLIEFSGTAGQVAEAFHAPIRKYVIDGEEYWANAADPDIPTALSPVVSGIDSLHNFPKRSLSRVVDRRTFTGKGAQFNAPVKCGLQSGICHALGPYDFAAIYNVLPLWNAGINGAGQTIAVLGGSNIDIRDVRAFRSLFGLPANDPLVILNGRDPGVGRNGAEVEANADIQWAGAVAPGATIALVVSATTNSTFSLDLSAEYAIENDLAPILAGSYANCELFLGTSGNQFHNLLWQQAAAQGITVLIGTGDSGSSDCDLHTTTPPSAARYGLAVSGIASTPYNVAVGGTDFGDASQTAGYWNSSNDAVTQASAKGYIPETTFNGTCTNPAYSPGSDPGSGGAEANCNNFALISYVRTLGGTGGKSACTISDGQNVNRCGGGYAKPAWQSGPGVPNDGARDVPDVSLFGAADSPSGSAYVVCESDVVPGRVQCDLGSPYNHFLAIGGTSISGQAFAGMMALVVQRTNSRQGNANAVLYELASQESAANCGASGSCVFHDVTTGTIAMPCVKNTPNCVVTNFSNQYGIVSGHEAGVGYDLATGLGSVNAYNLVNAAAWATNDAPRPAINVNGIVNAASYASASAVAPGSIASIFGTFGVTSSAQAASIPLPLALIDIAAQFEGGISAPLFFVSGSQLNFQVPWELEGLSQAPVAAFLKGQASLPQRVSLAPFAPGIFSTNSSGAGPGAILDASYRLVGPDNPAMEGAILQIFCTGLGAVSNRPATGEPAGGDIQVALTTTTPQVKIGGVPATVTFSGLAPSFVGLYQVNAKVAAATPKGAAVPVVIEAGGVTSNSVTIAVQ